MTGGYNRRITTGLFVGLLFGLLFPSISQAATVSDGRESITLSPVNKHYKLDAAGTKSDSLTVINDGATDYTFTVYAKPYSVNDENYEPDFFTTRTNTDLESWITFSKKSYFAKAGQVLTIPYTINVPRDATPGGHYGVIFAETQPSGGATTTVVERKKRVGTLVYLTVNGEFDTGGIFHDIRTPGLQFEPPLKTELNVENTGDSDFAVDTVFAVSDIFGNRKYTDTKQHQMLPNTKRKIQLEWTKSPSFGLFKVTVSGKFNQETVSKTTYVLMAPLLYYMVFVVGLLVAVIFFVQKRR